MKRREPQLRSSPRKREPRATERGPWIPSISAFTRVFDAPCAGMNGMERRTFILALGAGAAVAAWPLAARAQQSPTPVIGFLRATSAYDSTHLVAAFQQGLKQAGLIDGQNVAMEYRWAEGQEDRLPELAADLVRRRVAVIVGHSTAAQAAKAASSTTPIIFVVGSVTPVTLPPGRLRLATRPVPSLMRCSCSPTR
jgi:ABC transporter substrate binding protein